MTLLTVPYRSQWDADAASHNADCGPTCAAMMLNAFAVAMTPDNMYQFIGEKTKNQFTNFTELMGATSANGLRLNYMSYDSRGVAYHWLKQHIDAGKPFIALIKYHIWRTFTGNHFSGGHFVVVVGYDDQHVYVHDPLFGMWVKPRERGANLKLTTDMFLDGWGGFTPQENPNFACAIASRSMGAPVVTTPVVTAKPVETPSVQPTETAGVSGDLTPVMRRRIKALAAYIGAMAPDMNDVAETRLWRTHIGDWGEQTTSYTVQGGDTLLGIAVRFYSDGGRWRAIQAYNEIPNEMIYVGQRLRIPQLGNDNAHQNQALLSQVVFVAMSGELEPAEAIDYDALSANTMGIGFVEPDPDEGFE